MFIKLKRAGIAVLLLAASVLVPAQAANAADGCGEGWFKYGDGYLEKEQKWEAGSRNAWIYHSGRVRFCTDNDTFDDDERRRALIGYPQDSYPFESWIIKNGAYSSFCVDQTIKVHMSGIKTSESWSLGGSVSKDGPGINASYSATYETLTVTIPGARVCGPDKSQLIARTSGIVATAQDESGKIEWVELHTNISGSYSVNGTKYGFSHTLSERDYS
jgi:hypothetical protein